MAAVVSINATTDLDLGYDLVYTNYLPQAVANGMHPETSSSENMILVVLYHNTPWQQTNVISKPSNISNSPYLCIQVWRW